MTEQTHKLSQVLDTLLNQESDGKVQDSNSLNALLNSVIIMYTNRKVSNQLEIDVVLKIFKALVLLLTRSPSLIVENNNYLILLKSLYPFYNPLYYSNTLSTAANITLIEIISVCMQSGSLIYNKYLFKMRDYLIEILESDISFIIKSITNKNTGSKECSLININDIEKINNEKLSKISISVRILELLLSHSLKGKFMLQFQTSLVIDSYISRTWFCLDNLIINMDFQSKSNDESDLNAIVDQLYSILLLTTVDYYYNDENDSQFNRLQLSLNQTKKLLNSSLILKFPTLQVILAESLLKLTVKSFRKNSLEFFFNSIDITVNKLSHINHLNNLNFFVDLKIVINLLLLINSAYSKSELILTNHAVFASKPFNTKKLEPLRSTILSLFNVNLDLEGKQSLLMTSNDDLTDFNENSNFQNILNDLIIKYSNPLELNSTVKKIYAINTLGKLSCIISDNYNFESGFCKTCDPIKNEKNYLPQLIDKNRPLVESNQNIKLIYEFLLDNFIINTENDTNITLSILISLDKIFKCYRPPKLSKELFLFIKNCFTSIIREIRLLSVKLLPLFLYCNEDDQFESDFDLILKFLSSFKPNEETFYLFENIIMSFGELLIIKNIDYKYFIILNQIIQFMGDTDEFRSNLAIHELRIVAKTKNITPWKLVEPFIPLISIDLIKKRKLVPGLIINFCECIDMKLPIFLKRTQEYSIPIFILSFKEDQITYICSHLNRSKDDVIKKNLIDILAFLMTVENKISRSKITNILSIYSESYKKIDFNNLLYKIDSVELIWKLLCYYNNKDEMFDKIKSSIKLICTIYYGDDNTYANLEEFFNQRMKLLILGIAQNMSGTFIHQRGNKPFMVKIQAIRAVVCLLKLTKSLESCLTQVMTSLQIALETEELQLECLECLKIMVTILPYTQLNIIFDLLVSYLLQKFDSFNDKGKKLTKEVFSILFKKDELILKDHPSYFDSLSRNSELNKIKIVKLSKFQVIVEYSRRLSLENKWIIQQALDDTIIFFQINQLNWQHEMTKNSNLYMVSLSLISNLILMSNKYLSNNNNSKLSLKFAKLLSLIGSLDFSKLKSSNELIIHQSDHYSTSNQKSIVITNLENPRELIIFSIHFLNNILVKNFISSVDPQKQLVLAYSMQEFLKLISISESSIKNEKQKKPFLIWKDLSELSKTVLRPLMVSKYCNTDTTYYPVSYPIYHQNKKHSTWLRELAHDLLYRASVRAIKDGNASKGILKISEMIIKNQDLNISEFLLPYAMLYLIIFENDKSKVKEEIKTEISTILNQELDEIHNDVIAESLKSCYKTIFAIVDHFREWISAVKRDQDLIKDNKKHKLLIRQREKVEVFLDDIPTALLAKRTAQCNCYERAIFNLEQSFENDTIDKIEFFDTMRDMYVAIDDVDSLQGVLKKFSTDSLNDKLLQFKYSEDWQVTNESLNAIAQYDLPEIESEKFSKTNDSVTGLLNCLESHSEYDQLILNLKNFENSNSIENPSKDWSLYGLQASIFTGDILNLNKWASISENFTSISSPGSELSIYYEAARGLISLNENNIKACLKHIENAMKYTGLALSISKDVSHIKVPEYLVLLHGLYEFQTLASTTNYTNNMMVLFKDRLENSNKDFKTIWKIHSLRQSILKLHPNKNINQLYQNALIKGTKILRECGRLPQATKTITHALVISKYDDKSSDLMNLEFAKLLWEQNDHQQALKTLGKLIEENFESPHINEFSLTYTQWLEISADGSSDEIKRRYESLRDIKQKDHNLFTKVNYQYGLYLNKLLDAQTEVSSFSKSNKNLDGKLEYDIIKCFIRSTTYSNIHSMEVLPKAITIWLDYFDKYKKLSKDSSLGKCKTSYDQILNFVKISVESTTKINKWYCVLSQLISRMIHPDDQTVNMIIMIITSLTKSYPHVILYSVFALSKSNSKKRSELGQKILSDLQTTDDKVLKIQIQSGLQLLVALMGICQRKSSDKFTSRKMKLFENLKFGYPKNTPCASLALPIKKNFDLLYTESPRLSSFITYESFEDTVTVISSMQKPLRLYIRGSDMKKYSILCKPHDDLRKDAKLLEFATVVDRLLKNSHETAKRNLSITTYSAVPLNENMGVIEWVDNVTTIRTVIFKLLNNLGNSLDFNKVKQLLETEKDPELKLQGFRKLLKQYPPVLQKWFSDQFPDAISWYNARINFTRSIAVMSIVGYLVGMGDRHGDNILINDRTGGIMHVDFDCLFDKGKKLNVPEVVPFRLTPNIISAMGVLGYEGGFRKTCEITMKVLRNHENVLMNILESFLYDPIMDWQNTGSKRNKVDKPEIVMSSIRRKIRGVLEKIDMDTGCKDSGGLSVSVSSQVDALIQTATSENNLSKMFVGWMAFL